MSAKAFRNPFRPGAGHPPPYLAGREEEKREFKKLLRQDVILENLVLTGLRGVGKTVLLDTFKPVAIEDGWLWVGTDLSESTSLSEERIALRMITDLSVVTSGLVIQRKQVTGVGFKPVSKSQEVRLSYETMASVFQGTPGLVQDKLKSVLELVWSSLRTQRAKGLILAYDEAQNLADHAEKNEYPLSLMLDVFQSIQKKEIPFMLALAGLPTLFPKLVEARTFAERMFHVLTLDRLSDEESREAIVKPIQRAGAPLGLHDDMVTSIIRESGGYPYFIQFMGREVYDAALQKFDGAANVTVSMVEIIRKLDSDFFAGHWARVTDRQRELLAVIAGLDKRDTEFTVQDIAEQSKRLLEKPFSPSHINQILNKLGDSGLIFKNRHGKYSFAVPLFGKFILRQIEET